jgi:LAO/AO transport system kinase
VHELAERIVRGELHAAARAMRLIDDRRTIATTILRDLFPHTGKAHIIGITGNPGAGKSTLTDRVIEAYRGRGKRVGVICVDPSSPYSGGAILGDRIRMVRHATDPEVFIRSVATRGHLGGLSRSARDMVRVMDAWGADVVLVETVGVGQDELEITRTAHSTVVVMAPGLGDEIQAIKAGLMESADIFAVNKADRDGADSTIRDVELMIALGKEAIVAMGKTKGHVVHGVSAAAEFTAHVGTSNANAGAVPEEWTPPIARCIATAGTGAKELLTMLDAHLAWSRETAAGRARRQRRLQEEVRESLREALIEAASAHLADEMAEVTRRVDRRETDPYTAIDELLTRFHAATKG